MRLAFFYPRRRTAIGAHSVTNEPTAVIDTLGGTEFLHDPEEGHGTICSRSFGVFQLCC